MLAGWPLPKASPCPMPSEAQALLERAIAKSGLSLRSFAETELARDERTVRRWRNGSGEIPDVVRVWLVRYLRE